MRQYFPVFRGSALFRGVDTAELPQLLSCLNARTTRHQKQEAVFREGQFTSELGFVLLGQAQITKDDYMGNRTIFADVLPGDVFAETYAIKGNEPVPINVTSVTESEILWLDCGKITGMCAQACGFHAKLIENLLGIMAEKNILLNRRIQHLSRRTTREKLLAYLSDQAFLQGSHAFEIPFNRQELADYLCVDRSAMSSALGKMREEGILQYKLNRFVLLRQSEGGF